MAKTIKEPSQLVRTYTFQKEDSEAGSIRLRIKMTRAELFDIVNQVAINMVVAPVSSRSDPVEIGLNGRFVG